MKAEGGELTVGYGVRRHLVYSIGLTKSREGWPVNLSALESPVEKIVD
jgi:hypothetical protein